jgi:hypothetical protein
VDGRLQVAIVDATARRRERRRTGMNGCFKRAVVDAHAPRWKSYWGTLDYGFERAVVKGIDRT